MPQLAELPRIPPSRRGYLLYLDHARVEVQGGRVVYLKAENGEVRSFNIPYINTSLVMLGEGTSLTRDAARMLARAGVMVAFAGTETGPVEAVVPEACTLLSPGADYRPTEWMQRWAAVYFDDRRRLEAGRAFLLARIEVVNRLWERLTQAQEYGLYAEDLEGAARILRQAVRKAGSAGSLLSAEGRYMETVYSVASGVFGIEGFVRRPRGEDVANRFLDVGYGVAYGMAGVVLHGLGLSPSFPVLHGRTRRGGLVFDVADLVKAALVVPIAFHAAAENVEMRAFRESLIGQIREQEMLSLLFDEVKALVEAC